MKKMYIIPEEQLFRLIDACANCNKCLVNHDTLCICLEEAYKLYECKEPIASQDRGIIP